MCIFILIFLSLCCLDTKNNSIIATLNYYLILLSIQALTLPLVFHVGFCPLTDMAKPISSILIRDRPATVLFFCTCSGCSSSTSASQTRTFLILHKVVLTSYLVLSQTSTRFGVFVQVICRGFDLSLAKFIRERSTMANADTTGRDSLNFFLMFI